MSPSHRQYWSLSDRLLWLERFKIKRLQACEEAGIFKDIPRKKSSFFKQRNEVLVRRTVRRLIDYSMTGNFLLLRHLLVKGNIKVTGNLTVGHDIVCSGRIVVTGILTVGGSIVSGGDITAGRGIHVGAEVMSKGSVTCSTGPILIKSGKKITNTDQVNGIVDERLNF